MGRVCVVCINEDNDVAVTFFNSVSKCGNFSQIASVA